MIKKIKMYIMAAMLAGVVAMPLVVSAGASAQGGLEPTKCGADFEINRTDCPPQDADAEQKVNNMIKLAVNMFSVLVGVVSVVMIIVGGLKYITSGGESANITSAKNTILYAVIGLVVVALAQIIVRFVLSRTSSAA